MKTINAFCLTALRTGFYQKINWFTNNVLLLFFCCKINNNIKENLLNYNRIYSIQKCIVKSLLLTIQFTYMQKFLLSL